MNKELAAAYKELNEQYIPTIIFEKREFDRCKKMVILNLHQKTLFYLYQNEWTGLNWLGCCGLSGTTHAALELITNKGC